VSHGLRVHLSKFAILLLCSFVWQGLWDLFPQALSLF
jgi:hypothetical protein